MVEAKWGRSGRSEQPPGKELKEVVWGRRRRGEVGEERRQPQPPRNKP